MATVAQVATALQDVLTTKATALERSSGFIKRQRILTGAAFVQGLVFGWLAHPEATYDQLAQAIADAGVVVSPQAVEQRFTPEAARYLRQILDATVERVITARTAAASLLSRFAGVWLLDSSTISLPRSYADTWPGSGAGEKQEPLAAMKLHTAIEMLKGALRGPLLGPGRPHDRLSPLQHELIPVGGLRITDLGFYALAVLRRLSETGAFWLCRAQSQTILYSADGARWTLLRFLAAQHEDVIDVSVTLGATARVPARLIAFRLDPEAAARRRRRLRRQAKQKGTVASPERLALCSWDVCVTNVPADTLTPDQTRVLLRVRWQIELLFKLWKDQGKLDESRSQQPTRILCELYAKLIGLVIQHWCLVVGCWHDLERSQTKAARVVREFALPLARAMTTPSHLRAELRAMIAKLGVACRLNTRKTRPNLSQLIRDSSCAA